MAFAIFDIETRIDKRLINQVFFPHDKLSDEEAFLRFREDPRNRGGEFLGLTMHVPISIAVGNVGEDYRLESIESLAQQSGSEEALVREFWHREEGFHGVLVSFNGRRFDLPVLELAALKYGIAAPRYFSEPNSPRMRRGRHIDLYDVMTNYGAVGLRGGMDLLLKMIGLPGKTNLDGSRVQEFYDNGRLADIHHYCRTDVIQTYFLFLRVELMRGRIEETTYRRNIESSAAMLEQLRTSAGPEDVHQ